ncbi:hypothetical protein EDB83DRAFT_2533429 [Lactarius deliciosus]|nr:hypothetical protein EDB83DRAFT_2533429 [Lactarius deliciosus]
MALPPTTTISCFFAPTAESSHASSPMEDDNENPYQLAVDLLSIEITCFCDNVNQSKDTVCNFLTKHSSRFPQGLPHALGLHLTDEPLSQVLTAQAELIRVLTAEVCGLTAIVHKRLPPPGVPAPAPPSAPQLSALQPSAQAPPKLPTAKPPTPKAPVPQAQAPSKPSAHAPSFAAAVKVPTRPSLVLTPAPSVTSSPSLAIHKMASEICAHLNSALASIHLGSSISAV